MIPIRPTAAVLREPFWAELARGRLCLQRCAACGRYRHPPGPVCAGCRSFDSTWVPASGDAMLHSFTEVFHPVHPCLSGVVPYVVTLVDLAEGVRMVSGVRTVPASRLAVGMALRCRIVRVDAHLCLPYFEPPEGDPP